MKIKLKNLLLITTFSATSALIVGCSSSNESSHTDNNSGAAKALIQKITNKQVIINQTFDSPAGLYGFVVTADNGQEGIIYTTKDGKYIINGQILDADGNLTQKDFEKYIEPKATELAYDNVRHTDYIQQGSDDAKHKMYIVVDPNCSACHTAYILLQDAIKNNDLAVRWVVVGMIKPSSPAKAMAILTSKKPLASMEKNENKFDATTEEGGITPLLNPSEEAKKQLAKNMDFLQKAKIMATPVFIYQTKSGVKKLIKGLPQTAASETIYNNASNQW